MAEEITIYKPEISIIVPVYNAEKYINSTLDALKNQTLKNIEIILVNDCSTDKSLHILNDYAKKDNRFKVISLNKNSGPAMCRNEGLKVAKGDYIGFCDCDDFVDLNFYEELYKKAVTDNADIVKGLMRTIDLSGDIIVGDINSKIEKNRLEFLYEFTSAVYKSSFLSGNNIQFPEKYRTSEDFIFLINCIIKTKKVSLINNVYYNYCRREKSLDKKRNSLFSTILSLKVINEAVKIIDNSNLEETNKNDYAKITEMVLRRHFYFLKQSSSFLAKYLCMKSLVKTYLRCTNKETLERYYKFKWMLPYIKEKKILKLTRLYNPESPNCPYRRNFEPESIAG